MLIVVACGADSFKVVVIESKLGMILEVQLVMHDRGLVVSALPLASLALTIPFEYLLALCPSLRSFIEISCRYVRDDLFKRHHG